MKNVFNGGLQLSVLDGWWAEAHDGTNGWAISGEVAETPEEQAVRALEKQSNAGAPAVDRAEVSHRVS